MRLYQSTMDSRSNGILGQNREPLLAVLAKGPLQEGIAGKVRDTSS